MMLTTNMQSAASSADVFEWRNTVCALCALDRPVSDSDVMLTLIETPIYLFVRRGLDIKTLSLALVAYYVLALTSLTLTPSLYYLYFDTLNFLRIYIYIDIVLISR